MSYMRVYLNVPASGSTMPDWARAQQLVFIVLEHVRCGYLEYIVRKVVMEQLFIMKREPDFLQKDNLGTEPAEEIS